MMLSIRIPKSGTMDAKRIRMGIKDMKKKNAILDACVPASLFMNPFILFEMTFTMFSHSKYNAGVKSSFCPRL
jgi:hypothetical protein